MAPSKATSSWDDEDSESTPPSSPPTVAVPVARRGKFDDEEDDDDVLDDWENDVDSEAEREKAKKAAEAKAKADAEAKANHKSKAQRVEEKRMENLRRKQELDLEESSDEEDEADKRARLRASEKESDLKHAEDLFGGAGGVPATRVAKPVTVVEEGNPGEAIDLSSLKLFQPTSAPQFAKLRDTLVPLLTANAKKPQYPLFLPEFCKQLCKEMNSDQVKKVASILSTLSNEKMKEEKAADKGGKKSKAAKTKTSLNANRNVAHTADTAAYDDGLDE